jgi:hypothetical protein
MTFNHTCINDLFDDAPPRRVLRGDKSRKLEAGTHIIEFPGGAVELARLEDGSYWAHIIVNRGQAMSIFKGMAGALGRVVDSRIDWADRCNAAIPGLPDGAELTQLAVRIMPEVPE